MFFFFCEGYFSLLFFVLVGVVGSMYFCGGLPFSLAACFLCFDIGFVLMVGVVLFWLFVRVEGFWFILLWRCIWCCFCWCRLW